MKLLEFVNSILALIGEQRLASTSGSLGTLTKNVAQSAVVSVAAAVRPQQFEHMVVVTNLVQQLPAEVLQIFSVFRKAQGKLSRLQQLPFEELSNYIGYCLVGNTIFVSPLITDTPLEIQLHCLLVPTLPASDDDDIPLPSTIVPAVQHVAASILLLSYLDDVNQAALHRNIADQMIALLRGTTGISRGRTFNIGYGT
jgi:hypothetical protein